MLVFSVLLAELVNANEPRVLLFLLIRPEMGRGWGAAQWCVSRACGQVMLICWNPAGDGAGLIRGGGWMGVRCPSAVGRVDTSQSRQRKPFALELPDAESKSAL